MDRTWGYLRGRHFVSDPLPVEQSARCLPSLLCLNNSSHQCTLCHYPQPFSFRGQRTSSRVASSTALAAGSPAAHPCTGLESTRKKRPGSESVDEGLRPKAVLQKPGLGDTSGMCWIPSPQREPLALEGHPEREMEQPVPWKQLNLSLLINHFPRDQSKPFSPRQIETLLRFLEDSRF